MPPVSLGTIRSSLPPDSSVSTFKGAVVIEIMGPVNPFSMSISLGSARSTDPIDR